MGLKKIKIFSLFLSRNLKNVSKSYKIYFHEHNTFDSELILSKL